MIVATAGHVDHGKTSLVRVLTGVDTDRLEEEKRRGLSIDLGFAYADFGLDEPIGFVDVPGHERFVRNMLAGVGAIDFALLVIAADDGPMPQTLEHLAILKLLGVSKGVVALTKIDRVDSARAALATEEIRAALSNSPLCDAPILPVAATIGLGVADLRDCIAEAARNQHARTDASLGHGSLFRLSIDRAFSLAGAGLVVTGAVHAGRAEVGDRVIVSPHGIEARIRSIHANNRASQQALTGQRCALNLAGLELRKIAIERGDWLVEPSLHAPTARIDVIAELLASEPRTLADGTLLQLHLAASTVRARVALLGGKSIAPGQSSLAQLVLERPIVALHGDRFVLRDQAAQRTVGGGRVIDPFAPARGRAKPARINELAAMQIGSATESLRQLLAVRADGVDLRQFERARNLSPAAGQQLRQAVDLHELESPGGFGSPSGSSSSGGSGSSGGPRSSSGSNGPIALSTARWQALRAQSLEQIAQYHHNFADHVGMRERNIDSASSAALRSLIAEGAVVRDGLHLRLPAHRAHLSDEHQAIWIRIEVVLGDAGLRPPIVGGLAKQLDLDPKHLLAVLEQACQLGLLEQVAPNRFFLPQTIAALIQVARDLAADSPDRSFDAASYRDRSGIGRNLTIQLLEYLDRSGFTRFARERRWMKTSR